MSSYSDSVTNSEGSSLPQTSQRIVMIFSFAHSNVYVGLSQSTQIRYSGSPSTAEG